MSLSSERRTFSGTSSASFPVQIRLAKNSSPAVRTVTPAPSGTLATLLSGGASDSWSLASAASSSPRSCAARSSSSARSAWAMVSLPAVSSSANSPSFTDRQPSGVRTFQRKDLEPDGPMRHVSPGQRGSARSTAFLGGAGRDANHFGVQRPFLGT